VFRALGDWNVQQGHWEGAANCFAQLIRANQVDKSDMTDDATRDLLRAAPALLMANQLDGYHRCVQETLAHFANTTNPVAAEHVIKVSLILPADAETIKLLKPLGKVVEQSIASGIPATVNGVYMTAWRSFALTQLEYRCGNFADAVSEGRNCLNYSDNSPSRLTMTHTILAMAYVQTGQSELARTELAAAWDLMRKRYPDGLPKSKLVCYPPEFWHDWVIAYLLLRDEATGLVK
jgi:eukaryotic-like serine/threonine-protein kinase